jgi:hypothetical protein
MSNVTAIGNGYDGIWISNMVSSYLTGLYIEGNNPNNYTTDGGLRFDPVHRNVSDSVVTNSIILNNFNGISLHSASYFFNNLTFYNNIFNNSVNVYFGDPYDVSWNSSTSGNFWAYPNGTGYSETCNDTNHDGICDDSYVFDNNTDYFPLTFASLPPAPPSRISETIPFPFNYLAGIALGFGLIILIIGTLYEVKPEELMKGDTFIVIIIGIVIVAVFIGAIF